MREKRVECPKCRKAMSAGYAVGVSKWEKNQPVSWAPGVPQVSMWTGLKLNRKHVLPITAYRCESCGYLEFYAGT